MEDAGNTIEQFEIEQKKVYYEKSHKFLKILLIIGILIILGLIIGIIVLAASNKSKDESKDDTPQPTPTPNITFDYYGFYGNISQNLSYSVNDKIENSFKEKGGENYIEEIGNLNNGEDYPANERNYYDLYIPQYALSRKNEINGIMLWIHGGAWIGGDMRQMEPLCKLFSQQGYISATIGYTLLLDYFKIFNIYRILDEITAAIKAIKNELIGKGFNGDKLVLGIGGYSAGGHLALLYTYLIKNIDIIPIKFVVDMAGPIGLHEKYFYKLKSNQDTLDNIENVEIIENEVRKGKLVKILNVNQMLRFMDAFSGNKYTQYLNSMVDEKGEIDTNNIKYKEMYNFIKYGYITEIEDKHKLRTIAIYGGIDEILGISTYAYLKEKADKDKRILDFIYSRYEGHSLIFPTTEDGKQKIWDASVLIMNYFKTFFTETKQFDTYKFFGIKYENLSYAVDDKIENSFKTNGENYIEDIGNLNNGEDYPANERNIFDLYIPDSAQKNSNKANLLMVWLHGGNWTNGDKSEMEKICEMYAEQGYITANVEYTILNEKYKPFNIYRILDEITAAIKAIKNALIEKGFNIEPLLMTIGGYSAGGHLSLLYTYLIENVKIIPIQFVINFAGPIGLKEEYFYTVKSINDTLANIDNKTEIEKAKQEGKLIPLVSSLNILIYMNAFGGNMYSLDVLKSMINEDGTINKEDERYKAMYKIVNYSDVTNIIDKHVLPAFCIYGGKDNTIGVSSYAYLKEKADKDGRYLELIYSRYEDHMLIYPETNEGKEMLGEIGSSILYYLNYFLYGFKNIVDYYDYIGTKYENLNYDVNGKIENTFKENGENYKEDIGNLNDGNDYEKSDRNIYDLYIPDFALKRKNEINGIILYIHGGSFTEGYKDEMTFLCKLFGQQGYITANFEYTLLSLQYKNVNIYRLMDEITSCIKSIKSYLINLGFDGSKLKLAIGGYSAGSHLSLLYSYLIKKFEIKPEFIINFVGPVGLYEEYFYTVKNLSEPLDNIEDLSKIEQAKKDGKLKKANFASSIIKVMNNFYGNKYKILELQSMLDENRTIIKDNDKYKAMDKVIKYSYITQIEDSNKIPTICIYGGIDDTVGITNYAYLKQKADQDGRPLDLIYIKDQGHLLIQPTTPTGFLKLKEALSKITEYSRQKFGY